MQPNVLAFLALANEYCSTVENCVTTEPSDFLKGMTRLLPRLYISATDLPEDDILPEDACDGLMRVLEEDVYDSLRNAMAALLGEDDTYLEVFKEDMKYSDTPIAASISEGLADIYQSLYDLLESVRDASEETTLVAVADAKYEFRMSWSATLCNVLRAVNQLVNEPV